MPGEQFGYQAQSYAPQQTSFAPQQAPLVQAVQTYATTKAKKDSKAKAEQSSPEQKRAQIDQINQVADKQQQQLASVQAQPFPQPQGVQQGQAPLVRASNTLMMKQPSATDLPPQQPAYPSSIGPGDPWATGAPRQQPQTIQDPWAPKQPAQHPAWWYDPGF